MEIPGIYSAVPTIQFTTEDVVTPTDVHQHSGSKDDVSHECEEYRNMKRRWDWIDIVLGDTLTLHDCSEEILPKLPHEKKGYRARVKHLRLTPWFDRLTQGLIGVVMRKKPDITAMNEQMQDHFHDVTLCGDDLKDFMRSVLLEYVRYGTVGVLVDAPNQLVSLRSQEVALNIRPYWSMYRARQILGFRVQRMNNVRKLTQVRLSESVDEFDGMYGVKKVPQVRVLTLRMRDDGTTYVEWILHRKGEREYVPVAIGEFDADEIPFYMADGYSYCVPPFLQIAFMNLAETRKNAELDHLLSICANQMAVFAGFDFIDAQTENNCDGGQTIKVSPEDGFVTDNPQASVKYVGADVAPAEKLMERIDRIQRDMMNVAIAAMYAQKNMAETAESKRIDRIQSDSMMAVIADILEQLFQSVLIAHGAMMKISEVGKLQVNKDFSNELLSVESARFYSELVIQQRLTVETFFDLLIRGELLPDNFDVTTELERLGISAKLSS
jgi:hypothetical protein